MDDDIKERLQQLADRCWEMRKDCLEVAEKLERATGKRKERFL